MTTPDAPRHLPPTPAERLKTIATRAASGSGQGATGFYRPVQPPRVGGDGVGGLVVTGEVGDEDATSISSTSGGDGSSSATGLGGAIGIGPGSDSRGFGTVAIGKDSYAAGGPDPTNLGATAVGPDARAAADEATAVGPSTRAYATDPAWGPTAVGPGAESYGDGTVSVGRGARAGAPGAEAAGAVALGPGANAPNPNDFVLGHSGHNVQVPGKLIIADDVTGALYHVVLSGGALTFVAYP